MMNIEERLTDRLNRTRVELELRRAARPLLLVLIGVALAAASAAYVASNVGKSAYSATREMRFAVADASGVISGNRQEVTFKGIPAGSISNVELDGGRAVITAKVRRSFGPLYRDARVTLRPRTALEDMYVDIVDRGTPAAGELTGRRALPVSRTTTSVQVEDVLQVFQPRVRTHLAAVLDELGGGLDRRGDDLRTAFVQVMPFVRVAADVAGQLERRSALTRRLVSDVGSLSGELGRRQRDLSRLVTGAGTTLRTVQRDSGDLDRTLARLPRVLRSVADSFAALRGVLPDVDTALERLRPATARLPAGLAAARSLADEAEPAIRALRIPVRELQPLARQLRPVSGTLSRLVGALEPQVPHLAYATKKVEGCPAALQGFFQWTPSLVKFEDSRGTAVRGDAAIGLDGTTFLKDSNVIPTPSCVGGRPVGGEPGPGGTRGP